MKASFIAVFPPALLTALALPAVGCRPPRNPLEPSPYEEPASAP